MRHHEPTFQPTASTWTRLAVRLGGLVALLALATAPLIVSTGCRTPEQRYKVLSFFFDGVPPPGGVEVVRTDDQTSAADAQAAREKKPQTLSIHLPYQNRECFKCHGSTGTFQVSVADIAACNTCHSDYGGNTQSAEKWVHGAMSLGCNTCHVPHKSEQQSLLIRPQMETCMDCHQIEPVLDRPYHDTARSGLDRCGKCHDPHQAGNRLLLADSDTYRHRQLIKVQPVSVHAPFKNHECAKCHVVEELNRVRDNIDSICQSCHADVIEQAPPDAHKPIREGKCVSCHNPHDSANEHLVRVTAEKMCYACHKPEETQTPKHPSATQSDCLLCHKGHHSENDKLLRRALETPASTQPLVLPKTPAFPSGNADADHAEADS